MVEYQKARNRLKKLQSRCPECDAIVSRDAIRIQDGVAHCEDCGTETRLSEINLSRSSREEILDHPPDGCKMQFEEHGVRLTASYYSRCGFLYLLKGSVLWNGIVILLWIAVSTGLMPLSYLWFMPRELGQSVGLEDLLIPRLVWISIVAIGVLLILSALVNLLGRIEVFVGDGESYFARCLGSIRWKMPFDPSQVDSVHIRDSRMKVDGLAKRLIEIRGETPLRFGSWLQSDRLVWLHAGLKKTLMPMS